jgi:hypothetical protein
VSNQNIQVTIEVVEDTLRKLAAASEDLRHFGAMSPNGGPRDGHSTDYRGALDWSVDRFAQSTRDLRESLADLRENIRVTTNELIERDATSEEEAAAMRQRLDIANMPPRPQGTVGWQVV